MGHERVHPGLDGGAAVRLTCVTVGFPGKAQEQDRGRKAPDAIRVDLDPRQSAGTLSSAG